MNGRRLCKIALTLVAVGAMAAGGPTLAGGRGGGGGMHGGGFHGHDGFFHHDGFHHGHGHVTFVVGGGWPGWWGYPYYGWPYPDSYPGYYVPAAQYAVRYIEQGDGWDGASANAWWYRCDQPSGYYPYIKDCPAGWQTVPAQPSP